MVISTTSFCAVGPQQGGRGPSPHRNEPKSARKPLPRPQMPRIATASPEREPDPDPDRDRDPSGSKDKDTRSLVKAFSTLSSLTTLTDSDSEKKTPVAGDVGDGHPAPRALPAHVAVSILGTPKTPLKAKPKSTPTKTPRTSKKALALAEQAERAAYAQSLFDELNRGVFAGGLPVETTLIWSNRLLTTAGRARWHRCVRSLSAICYSFVTCCQDRRKGCTRPRSSSQRRFWTPKASESFVLEIFVQVERTFFFTSSQNASGIHCHMRCATSPAGSSIRIRKKATGRPGNRGGSGETCPEDDLRPVTRSSIT
jgi:hypothetical protein